MNEFKESEVHRTYTCGIDFFLFHCQGESLTI